MPDELVDEVSQLSSSSLPPKGFNRHRRRRISRCRSAVVHLFCGSSRHAFDHVVEKYNTAMIAVDLSEDLNDPATYQFLIQHALDGRVDVLLAGLPCRTRSALRGRGEGLPVVRGRTGPTRWGLPEICFDEQEKVVEDDLLWVRTLALAAAAQRGLENRFGLGACLGFGLENPADPLEVFGQSHSMNPSWRCTPEHQTLEGLLGLEQVKLDQGPLGHAIRKPSTLAVTRNMWPGIGPRKGDKSSDWAERAPGLKQAFSEFVEAVLQRSSQSQEVVAKAVVNQSFRDHILAGHVPFRKDCYSCVAGRSKKGSYFRQDISEAFVLSLDLAGPLPTGEHEKSKARYFLAASFSVPVDPRINGSQETEAPEDPHEPEAVGWDLDLEEEESEVVQEPDSLPAAAEAEQLEELKLAHLPFVVPLSSKRGPEVLGAVKAVEAQLAALGCSITRIHSDAGMEFCNAPFRAWCRDKGFHKTNTGGDRFKANPHAESLIGIVKRCAWTLMIDAGVAKDQWPYAVRHAPRQRFSHMAKLLGWKMSPVVPCGAQVYVRQRSWRLGKGGEWNLRVIKASVLSPARELSQGYLVRTAEGELLTTPSVYEHLEYVEPSRFVAKPDTAQEGKPLDVPTHRVNRKSKPVIAKILAALLVEDERAGVLATASTFDVCKACEFVVRSVWRQGCSGKLRRRMKENEASARVVGMFRHGGVVGLTKELGASPGMARLLVRIVCHLVPEHPFTTLTLLSQACLKPHKDNLNLPCSNVVIPLQLPNEGRGIWVQDPNGCDVRQVTEKYDCAWKGAFFEHPRAFLS